VSNAVDSLLAGHVVLIADESGHAGYLAFAGSKATASTVAWTVRHGSGFICAAMLPDRAGALGIALVDSTTSGLSWPRYGVPVDAASGISTGISSRDRARTIAALADPASVASDFKRPGHVVVEYVAPGGVLARSRPGEALIDLLRITELPPVGGLCALVRDELGSFCVASDTTLIGVGDLIAFRKLTEPATVVRGGTGRSVTARCSAF
jgi:3,4-dihydroxy 2-butanone 4-phosphate synthase/GTP cyclohydrolase II